MSKTTKIKDYVLPEGRFVHLVRFVHTGRFVLRTFLPKDVMSV